MTGVVPANKTKTGAATKKQRPKKQASPTATSPRMRSCSHATAGGDALLCQLATDIRQMSPWKFVEKTDVFGFHDPENGALGFVSRRQALSFQELNCLNSEVIDLDTCFGF